MLCCVRIGGILLAVCRFYQLPVVRHQSAASETMDNNGGEGVQAATFMDNVDLDMLSTEQKGFLPSIRLFTHEARDGALGGEQVKAAVAEMFPPAVIFGSDLVASPYAHRNYESGWILMAPSCSSMVHTASS